MVGKTKRRLPLAAKELDKLESRCKISDCEKDSVEALVSLLLHEANSKVAHDLSEMPRYPESIEDRAALFFELLNNLAYAIVTFYVRVSPITPYPDMMTAFYTGHKIIEALRKDYEQLVAMIKSQDSNPTKN